jgi:putative transposase
LWEGRYKSSLVDSEHYFLLVSRYIEMNPVRANMVVHPAEYPWSSYHTDALEKEIKLITPHPTYLSLGSDNGKRKSAYQALFNEQIPHLSIKEIRDATNKAWVLGNNRFKQQIEQQVGRPITVLSHGGDRKSANYKDKLDQQL